mmetsp:Transcript_8144/g.19186  ORF Transcript_8144/g.19186 Transcript_8144/m.19186 type:complete len:207 (-) Transcript_8144:218-838(-)
MGGKVCKLVCQRLAESGDALDKCQKTLVAARQPNQTLAIGLSAKSEASLTKQAGVANQEEDKLQAAAPEGEKAANQQELAKRVDIVRPATVIRSEVAPALSKRTSSKPSLIPAAHGDRSWRRSTTSPALVYTNNVPLRGNASPEVKTSSKMRAPQVISPQASNVQRQSPRVSVARVGSVVVPGTPQIVAGHAPDLKPAQMPSRAHV